MDTNSTRSPAGAGLREPTLTSSALTFRQAIVLDTNIVLDWLAFRDPSSAPIACAIEQRLVRWVATTGMRDELVTVLQRGLAAARSIDTGTVLAAWDTHAETRIESTLPASKLQLRCADPDDQMFLDLALRARARWLLSRDRAVLRLTRRAAALGLVITTPEAWSLAP